MDSKNNKQINIELPESEAGGKYSNLVLVAHSPSEFVLDFTQVLPGLPKAKIVSRLILSPQHTKGLFFKSLCYFRSQIQLILFYNCSNDNGEGGISPNYYNI